MDAQPALAPSIDASADDAEGYEDPSVVRHGRRYHVCYSGWNQGLRQSHLLRAVGADMRALRKQGRMLPESAHRHNPKEAENTACTTGGWRLFFEYADAGRSKIGLAKADSLDGPWRLEPDLLAAREDHFDTWHLSPGPVIQDRSSRPLMLYNGATQQGDWRIGWITFDEGFSRALDRCEEPVITPPAPQGDARDVTFAVSAVQDGRLIRLYYTIGDDQPTRAVLRLS
jgi:predicted GH43/DUF377 family glycosyl hydrolase